MKCEIKVGHVLDVLRTLPANHFHAICTSPPYWGLRDYGIEPVIWGHDVGCTHQWGDEPVTVVDNVDKKRWNHAVNGRGEEQPEHKQLKRKAGSVSHGQFCQVCSVWKGCFGLEPTIALYIEHTVQICRELWRVLRDDGVMWWNIGDSYNAGTSSERKTGRGDVGYWNNENISKRVSVDGLTPKNKCLIPHRVAIALQDDGWIVRSDIVWCLSGGTWVYVKSQKGEMPMMVRDMYRLDPSTVKLWNGSKWTQVLGMSRSPRSGKEIELVLRSGERISCTPNHQFPTSRGLVNAGELDVGDVLSSCVLPEPSEPKDCVLDEDAAWFAGLYIAEGSVSGQCIQLAGHAREVERWERVNAIASKFGGRATITTSGNRQNIRVYGKVLQAILSELVTGRVAADKGFAPVVWRYSNAFLESMMDGYLSGDGHYDAVNDRWRLGFTRNYNLERDIRVACCRLNWRLTLNMSTVSYKGARRPTFRGELRKAASVHHNNKSRHEIVAINSARCRYVYDIGVSDEPHLYSLASGVLTHNSKRNAMPESVTDRPSSAHEFIFCMTKEDGGTSLDSEMIFQLTKQPRYYYDSHGERQPLADKTFTTTGAKRKTYENDALGKVASSNWGSCEDRIPDVSGANLRNVWNDLKQSAFTGQHFAVFPLDLPLRCFKLSTSAIGCCSECGAPWKRVIEKDRVPTRPGNDSKVGRVSQHDDSPAHEHNGSVVGNRDPKRHCTVSKTVGWEPTCKCNAEKVPCRVLDPFNGAGTSGIAARQLGLDYTGIEINPDYAEMARQRIQSTANQGVKAVKPAKGQKELF